MQIEKIASRVSEEITQNLKPVKKPTVLLLMGLQYSGKSYLAERIAEKNFAHLWATKIKKEYHIDNIDMVAVAQEVIRKTVEGGFNIIVDYVNHKHEVRMQFQAKAQELGAEYKVVFLDTSKQVRMQRRDENVASGDVPGRRVISLLQMQEFEDEFEPPTAAEPTVALRVQGDIDQFLASL